MFNNNKTKKQETFIAVASVEPVIDQTYQSIGTINLIKTSSRFYLRFISSKNEKQQIESSISQKQENIPPDGFMTGQSFELDCRLIRDILFPESKDSEGVVFKISTIESSSSRKFVFKQNLNQLTEFIYQIFLNGIAVPSYSKGSASHLTFYTECSPNQFLHNSINIQPKRRNFETLDEFWKELISFSELYVRMLYKRNALDINRKYPLTTIAISDLNVFLNSIDDFLRGSPTLTKVTAEEFPTLFDEAGRMKDPESFRERAFYCGIDENILPEALPFLFRHYSDDSTSESRKNQDANQKVRFEIIKSQISLIKKTQLKRNAKLKVNSFDVIRADALRTDRDDPHGAFKYDFKAGMNMLILLLKVYCLYNQNIGYVQGMNDLFVPLIFAYLPNWDEEGDPVDSEGNKVSYEEFLQPKLFWLYNSMLRNIGHDTFLLAITPNCQAIAKKALKILDKISPILVIWLKTRRLSPLLFMYQDFIYLYKRSFGSIWDIWLQFHCSPDPKHWIVYFVCAVLIKTFPLFSNLPGLQTPEQCFSVIVSSFPNFLLSLDIRELGRLALWISQNYPVVDDNVDMDDEKAFEFMEKFRSDFFDADCFHKK